MLSLIPRRPLRLTTLAVCLAIGCADEDPPPAPPVVVSDAEPVTISVRPRDVELDPPARTRGGTSVQLTATAGFDDLTIRDVTDEATWVSSRPSVASVDAAGLVTAVSSGSAAISATLRGAFGYASVTVREEPRGGAPSHVER